MDFTERQGASLASSALCADMLRCSIALPNSRKLRRLCFSCGGRHRVQDWCLRAAALKHTDCRCIGSTSIRSDCITHDDTHLGQLMASFDGFTLQHKHESRACGPAVLDAQWICCSAVHAMQIICE